MDLAEFSFENLIFSLGISFFLHFVFIRKFIFSFLDPWLLLFFNQAIIFSVLIYYYLQNEILLNHFVYCVLSWFSFVFGLGIFKIKSKPVVLYPKIILTPIVSVYALKIYLSIFFINAGLIFYYMGIPLFMNGPRTISAYSNMGAGFGLLFYANWGLQIVIKLLSLKVWIVDNKAKLGAIGLAFLVIFSFLNGGSRSVYLDMIMIYSLGLFYMIKFKSLKLQVPYFFKYLIILLPAFILLSFISAVSVGYESNVFLAFIKRVVGTAEGPFYYFIKNSYSGFEGLNLFSYHFSQILPYFGYVDKNAIELGVNLTQYSDLNFGTSGYGPNPTMYVIGHIALGFFGFIYCFFIGFFLSYLRYRFKSSFFIWMLFNIQAISLTTDGTLMPLTLFYLVILSPIILIAMATKQVFYPLTPSNKSI